MALVPGTRLGPYEVVAPLGAGGMGEVYRARDTQLKRDVALKVLPEAFAHDTERLARFRREAELLASLNHPHIAAIYGLERAESATALVLELVDGDTLADVITRGPLPLDEALACARQIAEALEAAHERGVIHRDLKPANVKVRPDGTVKVLDFGLAKLSDTGAPSLSSVSLSPTLTVQGTLAGAILGTAAYMAPEQARGAAVDRRADLFAFGCVLFEMLGGRPAFDGGTVTEILASVLKTEPDWSALPAETPPAVRRLLRRCLQKDFQVRLQSAGDARLELTDAMSGADVVASAPAMPALSRARWLWPVSSGVLAMLAVALAAYVLRPRPAPQELRLDVATTPGTGDVYSFALSPDGRHIVYEAPGENNQPRLWLRALDSVAAQPIADPTGLARPFWSPDGRSIGFLSGGTLRRIDPTGGSSQVLAELVGSRGMAWGANVILFSPNSVGALMSVPDTGGPVTEATALAEGHISHRFPQFVPGARRFIFYVQGDENRSGVYLGSLDSKDITRLLAADTAAAVVPPDRLLFVRNNALLAQQVDFDRAQMIGEPVTIASSVEHDSGVGIGAFSTSATGLIAYRAGGASLRRLTWFDRTGKETGTWGPEEPGLMHPELSPDGRSIAVDREGQSNVDVWIVDALRTRRLTFDARLDHWPSWSPDGTLVAYDSDRNTVHDLFLRRADGGGEEEPLLLSKESKGMSDWARDGTILFTTNVEGHAFDLLTMRRGEDAAPKVFLGTPADERHAQFSPDGRWVAYMSNESGRYEVYVRPFPGPGGQFPISTAGGIAPRWSAAGREIFYVAPDGSVVAAPVTARGETFEAGTPATLFRPSIVFGGSPTARHQFDVSADGRFLVNVAADDTPQPPITIVVNWNRPDTP